MGLRGGKIKRTRIYDGNSLGSAEVRLDSYNGWKNFTMDNFVIAGAKIEWKQAASADLVEEILKSYNPDTGVLTTGTSRAYDGTWVTYVRYSIDLVQME